MLFMFPITSEEVQPGILSQFDPSKPTMHRAFNVLEGLNRGQILVDDPSYPTSAMVREGTYGTLYFGGKMNISLLEELVVEFRQVGDVGIGCWLDDPINEMIPLHPDYDGRTLQFLERSRSVNLRQFQLPPGFTSVIRDRELLKRSFDYESTLDAFGNEDAIMNYTHGIVILHEDQVVCEAATGAPTHGRIEVGVKTHESHRQRGLAAAACAQLINICEEQGYETWWDCAKQNTPSVKLAHKLGYQGQREYRYVFWPRKKV